MSHFHLPTPTLGISEPVHKITAVDTEPAIAIIYIGTEQNGTITAASGDLTFKHGDTGSEAVDSGIGSSGVLDLSTPAAGLDTFGELVDTINASTNWRAMLIGRLRADLTDGRIIDKSEVTCKVHANKDSVVNYWGGVALYHDTSDDLNFGILLSKKDLEGNDNGDCINIVSFIKASWTNGGTTETNTIQLYKVNDRTGVETAIGLPFALGDDPASVIIDDDDFGDLLLSNKEPGYGLLVRFQSAASSGATLTAPSLMVVGGREHVEGGLSPHWYKADQ